MIRISSSKNIPAGSSMALLATSASDFGGYGLSVDEIDYVKAQIEAKSESIAINRNGRWIFVQPVDMANAINREKENMRRQACKLHLCVAQQKIQTLTIVDTVNNAALACAFAEGMALSNYQFLKYVGKKSEKQHSLSELTIISTSVEPSEIDCLNFVLTAVYKTRDLVNEPANVLTPAQLASEIRMLGDDAGFDVQIFDKTAIEDMKMGGILAVNKGSVEAPAFSILEWKPSDAKNQRPVALAGKGVTFDTGGHNLKTEDFMDSMKCDMAGAATVAAVIYAVAKARLPLHVVGLIPSTDNRLSPNACSPGDIITMYDGTTVEVLNTDAEGRLILADALAYAKKYDPELVIDVATLTGAAHRAVGDHALAAMGNVQRETMERLKACGESVHERIVEFPLWDEYAECLRSDIADLKNIGDEFAGMITAGKFLEHFTAYPFIHLDVCPAFAKKADSYRGTGGTGFGVRLLFEFLKTY